ncbi:unnamed protein product [Cyclocybe aegerita]|uniref:F-box domain-containing protein n=1 Tax=Cyclocybe aegerita TaxID=1973307 RepID=A0A8S0W8C4_CYCAE|nr:unnamed protein product [Cyclocybe aegerita]
MRRVRRDRPNKAVSPFSLLAPVLPHHSTVTPTRLISIQEPMKFTSSRRCITKNRRFCDLPEDLLRLIFQCSDPLDLANLGKTCKPLYRLSSERITWLTAFKDVMAINDMFIPPNAIEECTAGALKYAATAPSRMLSLILDYPLLKKDPSKLFTHRFVTSEPVHDLFLIPGGCYLAILQDGRLDIWELNMSRISVNRFIASGVCRQDARDILSVFRVGGTSPLGLRIATGDKAAFYDTRINVYEYRPGMCDIPLIAELRTRGIITSASLRGNLCAVLTDESLVVWDYLHGLYASWPISPDDSFDKIFLDDDYLTISGAKLLNIWELPQLQTCPARADGPPPFTSESMLPPNSTYITSGQGAGSNDRFYPVRLHDWYNSNPEDLFTDTISNNKLTRHRLQRSQASGKPTLSGDSISIGPLGLRDAPVNTLKEHRLCNGFTVTGYNNEDSEAQALVAPRHLVSSDLQTPRDQHSAKAVLLSSQVQDERWSFDPTSGRLVYVDASEPDLRTICVVDLLKALENAQRHEQRKSATEQSPTAAELPRIIKEWVFKRYLKLKQILLVIREYLRDRIRNNIVN